MNIRTSLRSQDLALVRAWRKSVYSDRARVGEVHATDHNWLAVDAADRIIGVFTSERAAVFAILDVARLA